MRITTAKIISASLFKYQMENGYDPGKIDWDYINREESIDGGVLDSYCLERRQIQLRPEWHSVLASIDLIEKTLKGRVSDVFHTIVGPCSAHFSGLEVNILATAGRTLVSVHFKTGDWISFIAGKSEKNDFRFQGCFFGGGEADTTIDSALIQIRGFAEVLTTESFLEDRSLRVC